MNNMYNRKSNMPSFFTDDTRNEYSFFSSENHKSGNCNCSKGYNFNIEQIDSQIVKRIIGSNLDNSINASKIKTFRRGPISAFIVPVRGKSTASFNIYFADNQVLIAEKTIKADININDTLLSLNFSSLRGKSYARLQIGLNGNPTIDNNPYYWDDDWNDCMRAEVETHTGPATSIGWALSGSAFLTVIDCVGVASNWW